MSHLFLFGTLLDDDLRAIVAGADLRGHPAYLPGQRILRARDGDYPVLGPGDRATGLLFRDVPDAALARLHFYEEGFGYVPRTVSVLGGPKGPETALVYRPGERDASDGAAADGRGAAGEAAWSLAAWQREWGPLTRLAAREAMSQIGTKDGAGLRSAMPTIRVRASARLRAGRGGTPLELRHPFGRDDVDVIDARRPYTQYFALDEADLSHPTFAGGRSGTLTRAGLVSGDAVTVLPYDPVNDRVLLVEQFRYGPWMRGDRHPWTLEPVAGRIDPGETPEQAAYRETVEEARLTLHRLLPVASSYPSPGCLSEYLFSYVGLCDLPEPTRGRGGLAEEGEDIRTHVIAFTHLMDLVASGEADNTPLLMTAFWLARKRDAGTFGDVAGQ